MGESWLGIVIGTFVLVIAATAVIAHYRREHRRAELLRNLDRWLPRSQERRRSGSKDDLARTGSSHDSS
jgi:hypothetical protein